MAATRLPASNHGRSTIHRALGTRSVTTEISERISADAVGPARTTRHPPRRLFAEALDRTTESFPDPDEE